MMFLAHFFVAFTVVYVLVALGGKLAKGERS